LTNKHTIYETNHNHIHVIDGSSAPAGKDRLGGDVHEIPKLEWYTES